MNKKEVKNKAASVFTLLKNKGKAENKPFQELLQYYVIERFLYRVSVSPLVDKFILKGALMLRVWNCTEIRPTMDIDLLGKTSNNLDKIVSQFREILNVIRFIESFLVPLIQNFPNEKTLNWSSGTWKN